METRLGEASRFKRQAFYAVNDLRKAGPVARAAGLLLLALIVVNALLVFGETQPSLPSGLMFCMQLVGVASTLFFGAEYAVRVWTADLLYPDRAPVRARLRYLLSFFGVVDLLAFLPGVLMWFLPLSPAVVRAAYIVRLVRLLKLTRYMRGLATIERVFDKRRQEIVAAFAVLGLLTVTASVLMYEVENPVQPEKFDSVLTGVYWAMTTITSTGYGDLVPVTALGRLVGFLTMVLSIGVVAIPAGIFSAGFVAEFRAQDARAVKRAAEGDEGAEG